MGVSFPKHSLVLWAPCKVSEVGLGQEWGFRLWWCSPGILGTTFLWVRPTRSVPCRCLFV